MSLITVGTMAFDDVITPFGESGRIIGGSATYVAYAASLFEVPVKQVSIVGKDFPAEELKSLNARGVETEGVEIIKDKNSFYWKGKYHLDMNSRDSLVTDLNVLADFNPKIPASYQDGEFLMLGNLVPAVQKSIIEQMATRPKFIALDTMDFWMQTALDDLKVVLKMVDLLVINDSEARLLSGETSLVKAAKKISEMGPKTLIIKKGENGALLFQEDQVFFAPALPLEDVYDPTGAGDTFAGGFMGYIAKTGDTSFENMKTAIIVGSALASFCCEKFGTERLKEVSKEELKERITKFEELINFPHFS